MSESERAHLGPHLPRFGGPTGPPSHGGQRDEPEPPPPPAPRGLGPLLGLHPHRGGTVAHHLERDRGRDGESGREGEREKEKEWVSEMG